MAWLTLIINLIPLVIKLMSIAEQAFDNQPDSGEDKKAFVMGATGAVVGAVTDLSTGGQRETWEKLSDPISSLIDSVCGFLFPHKDQQQYP